jgi:predicted lipoprotein with Yx(FWY)xxD motif
MRNKVVVWLTVLLGALLLLTGGVVVYAASDLNVQSEAQIASDLGLLKGEGDGLTKDYLQKPTLRIQAAVLFLQLKGLEKEAAAYKGTDNFSDAGLVEGPERAILAYLKNHPELGWVGTGNNRFDPVQTVTPQQFYKVMLELLGYKAGSDFIYGDTLNFAKSKGLYDVAMVQTFRNRDLATAAVEALNAVPKGQNVTFGQVLSKLGVVSESLLPKLSYHQINIASNEKLGSYLTDKEGRTLYYYTKDVADINACQKGCLQAWPVYDADSLLIPGGLNIRDFGRFQRSDGGMQVTYKGWPLYYFAKDQNPGDVKGEDVGHVWFVIKVPEYTVAFGTNADLGNYLTDANGRSLYYFDKDTVGTSNCSGACIDAWPVFHSDSIVVPTGLNPTDFGSIKRADGTMQTTYKGYPLYYYTPDANRGDLKGQGFKDVWYVINPSKFDGTKTQKSMNQ